MSHDFHLRGLTERQHRALPLIAAACGLASVNALVLASVEAMIQASAENDPLIASALKLQDRQLPERIKVPARVAA